MMSKYGSRSEIVSITVGGVAVQSHDVHLNYERRSSGISTRKFNSLEIRLIFTLCVKQFILY